MTTVAAEHAAVADAAAVDVAVLAAIVAWVASRHPDTFPRLRRSV